MNKEKKILTVYNTCGLRKDNTNMYIESISSILKQKNVLQKVVVSSCCNSDECLDKLLEVFGKQIEIISFKDPYTVNITFNKTVQVITDSYGEFDAYLYIDSGVFINNEDTLYEAKKRLETGLYSMITIQVDGDAGYHNISPELKYSSQEPQIINNDYTIPVGKALNLHIQMFTNEIYKAFDSKIIPDVFAAYCTESTFPFLNASVGKKWVIVKDIICRHISSVDGASSSQRHISPIYNNTWNNLLFGRNAMDFINDKEAIECGLGYEECGNIMLHRPESYDSEENCLQKEKLKEIVKKYYFSNIQELDYRDIAYEIRKN